MQFTEPENESLTSEPPWARSGSHSQSSRQYEGNPSLSSRARAKDHSDVSPVVGSSPLLRKPIFDDFGHEDQRAIDDDEDESRSRQLRRWFQRNRQWLAVLVGSFCVVLVLLAVLIPVVFLSDKSNGSRYARDDSTGPSRLLIKLTDAQLEAVNLLSPVLRNYVSDIEKLNTSALQMLSFVDEDIYQEAFHWFGTKYEKLLAAMVRDFPVDTNSTVGLVAGNDTNVRRLQGLFNDQAALGQWGMEAIKATDAWAITRGSQVVVAVIDTGVDYTHPDLVDSMWKNPGEIPGNGIDDDGNGFVDDVYGYDFGDNDGDPMDTHGHGTHCAGTVAASGPSDGNMVGVAPKARIMALKVMNSKGQQYSSSVFRAFDYALRMGAHITSNSYGTTFAEVPTSRAPAQEEDKMRAYEEALQALQRAGVLTVCAAGNQDMDNDAVGTLGYAITPASTPLSVVVSVGATTTSNEKSSFSNYGQKQVDVGAPGSGILSTRLKGGYEARDGTSMATPHVAGCGALVLSVLMDLDGIARGKGEAVRDLLLATVDSFPQQLGSYFGAGGRINCYRAVQKALEGAAVRYVAPLHGHWEAHAAGIQGEFWVNAGSLSELPDIDVFGSAPDYTALAVQDFIFNERYQGLDGFFYGGMRARQVVSNNFAARLKTHLNLATGSYAFKMGADDGAKLYINGKMMINWDGSHMLEQDSEIVEVKITTAGLYRLEVLYYEGHGRQGLRVEWRPPNSNVFVPIPKEATCMLYAANSAQPLSKGLTVEMHHYDNATYGNELPEFDKARINLVDVAPNVNFTDYGRQGRLRRSYDKSWSSLWVARISGILQFKQNGTYQLGVRCDDGCKVFLDGTLILDRDGRHGNGFHSSAPLVVRSPCFMKLTILHHECRGTFTSLQLFWRWREEPIAGVPDQYEVIPSDLFFNDNVFDPNTAPSVGQLPGMSVSVWAAEAGDESDISGRGMLMSSLLLNHAVAVNLTEASLGMGSAPASSRWHLRLSGFFSGKPPAKMGVLPLDIAATLNFGGETVVHRAASDPDSTAVGNVLMQEASGHKLLVADFFNLRPDQGARVLKSFNDQQGLDQLYINSGVSSLIEVEPSAVGTHGRWIQAYGIDAGVVPDGMIPVNPSAADLEVSAVSTSTSQGFDRSTQLGSTLGDRLLHSVAYFQAAMPGVYVFKFYLTPEQRVLAMLGNVVILPNTAPVTKSRWVRGSAVTLKPGYYKLELFLRTSAAVAFPGASVSTAPSGVAIGILTADRIRRPATAEMLVGAQSVGGNQAPMESDAENGTAIAIPEQTPHDDQPVSPASNSSAAEHAPAPNADAGAQRSADEEQAATDTPSAADAMSNVLSSVSGEGSSGNASRTGDVDAANQQATTLRRSGESVVPFGGALEGKVVQEAQKNSSGDSDRRH